jgi:hypothetical protein
MKKHLILLLVLAVVAAGGAFSQEAESPKETKSSRSGKHAVMIDIAPLFTGLIVGDGDAGLSCFGLAFAYEYNIASHFSIGPRFGFYAGKQTVYYFSYSYSFLMLSAHGRWYPFSEGIEKLFLDFGLGIYSFNVDVAGFSRHTDLTFDLTMGYKLMFGKMFYIEPSLGYMLSDVDRLSGYGYMEEGIGEGLGLYKWHLGLGIGLRF